MASLRRGPSHSRTARQQAVAPRAEISYVMIKPDGVQRSLVGEVGPLEVLQCLLIKRKCIFCDSLKCATFLRQMRRRQRSGACGCLLPHVAASGMPQSALARVIDLAERWWH